MTCDIHIYVYRVLSIKKALRQIYPKSPTLGFFSIRPTLDLGTHYMAWLAMYIYTCIGSHISDSSGDRDKYTCIGFHISNSSAVCDKCSWIGSHISNSSAVCDMYMCVRSHISNSSAVRDIYMCLRSCISNSSAVRDKYMCIESHIRDSIWVRDIYIYVYRVPYQRQQLSSWCVSWGMPWKRNASVVSRGELMTFFLLSWCVCVRMSVHIRVYSYYIYTHRYTHSSVVFRGEFVTFCLFSWCLCVCLFMHI